MKNSNDYDSVFKTLKFKHKRLFITVINEIFGTDYPSDSVIDILPSEGFISDKDTTTGEIKTKERDTDFLIRIGEHIFLLECQTYDDGSMAIRIAEYAFISAMKFATWDNGTALIPMPHFAVIYVKRSKNTPKKTSITFSFPDKQKVIYESDNIFIDDFSKERIIEERLYPFIPFFIARHENELSKDGDISSAIKDIEYFMDKMLLHYKEGLLSDMEVTDLVDLTKTIITHITNGNNSEERLVGIMGGTVLELTSDRLIKIGEKRGERRGEKRGEKRGETRETERGIKAMVELCRELGKSKEDTMAILMNKFSLNESDSSMKTLSYWG